MSYLALLRVAQLRWACSQMSHLFQVISSYLRCTDKSHLIQDLSKSYMSEHICNGSDKRTGPLACLSLSSVWIVDKGQVPRSGIRPILLLFPKWNETWWVKSFTVTTVWNTGETGDIYCSCDVKSLRQIACPPLPHPDELPHLSSSSMNDSFLRFKVV